MFIPSTKTITHESSYMRQGDASKAKLVNSGARPISVWLAAGSILLLGACQKSETVPTTAERLKSVEQKQQTQPDFFAPRKSVDYMTDLKNLKDAPAKPEPIAVPAKVAETRPAPVAAPVPTPTRVAEPAPAPPAQVASAAPTARPAAPKPDLSMQTTALSREQPDFPREAIRQNIDTGTVRAKLTINAAGEVTNVAIVQSRPSRIFDRAVITSLTRWKFNPGADDRSYETEINFQR